ncbi:ThuA domain-containing protein [Sandarakinorhabdus limnophila]|uniref:ThuA domain-containing protein n=1 Tax=Sandarakinorhabdus limnophila TaxID=210512 RepID=UPI0026E9C716|nr:ThuA domain-containing protein [Sandarakinorhabdus limnophila]MCM0031655.1 ThuA domain-containing protein [Sandarakinorhabdus limnophila]
MPRRLAVLIAAALAGSAANAQSPAPPATPQGGPGGLCNAPCDPYPDMKKLLIVADVQSGYHHNSINHTMAVLEQLGRKAGVYVSFLRTDSQMITKGPITVTSARYARGNTNIRNLNYFDAVMILGSGEGTMSEAQKADLLSFVREDGKGLIVGHAQGINFYNWPEWGAMIGGMMASEYPATGMYAKVKDSAWRSAAAFGRKSFLWKDQWPVLTPAFKRGDVHTIIELDAARMTPEQVKRAGRSDGYFPIVWAKSYGKGRVFNMTGGHNDALLDDPKTQGLYLEGIKWALGLVNHDVTPDQ